MNFKLNNTTNKGISIVVPVYNEQGAVAQLHGEILSVCHKLGRPFEIIFINDGSDDKTLGRLKELKPVKIINFRKNFGQTAALNAGFSQAKERYIVAIDGDGQNDPNDIPALIEKIESSNLDVISGWRKNRKDSRAKKYSSIVAACLRNYLIRDGIHDSGCTLKIYKRECFNNVSLMGDMHRFIPAILKIRGYKIGEMIVNHRKRTTGKTKYGLGRGVPAILDMISIWFWDKYKNRPLHIFGYFGLCFICVAMIMVALFLFIQNMYLFIASFFSLFVGILLIALGLLADILVRNVFTLSGKLDYYIKEIIINENQPQ